MGKIKRIILEKPEKFIFEEVDMPVPGEGEVLLKVKSCGVCGSDPTIYHGRHPYAKYPLVMGHEFSGVIDKVGDGVKSFYPGQKAVVFPLLVCTECKMCIVGKYNLCEKVKCLGAQADGAYQQYISIPAEAAMPIPDSMSYDEAAAIEPASVAYHATKRANITVNDEILIIGAGPIGNFAMQSCKAFGAKKVYVADIDQDRLDLALKLGADKVINLKGRRLDDINKGELNTKDISIYFDCVGQKGAVLNDIIGIARSGIKVIVVGVLQNEYIIPKLPDFVEHELMLIGNSLYIPQDFIEVIELMGKNKIKTDDMITHHFPISDVEDAYKMIDSKKEKFFKIMLVVDGGFK